MTIFQSAIYLAGRILLALYFIVPGIIKVADVDGAAAYINSHHVPFVMPVLALPTLLQSRGGICCWSDLLRPTISRIRFLDARLG